MRTKKKLIVELTDAISELVSRRNEVVKRAAAVANRKIPQAVLNIVVSDVEIMKWIVLPHLEKEYKPIITIDDSVLRRGTELVSAYLHDKEEDNEEESTGKET